MTNRAELLQAVRDLAKTDLRPLVDDIDRKGLYPQDFMHKLGNTGAFACVGSEAEGGNGLGLAAQIDVIRAVGGECGATAFSVWCQTACGWYLHQSSNPTVRERYQRDVLQGKKLAGTGMSNTVKHLAGIEKHLLQAEKTDGGYIVNGTLPWVSNIGEDHLWASTAQIGDSYVMFITGGHVDGVSLHACPEFCALEGTRTFSVRFENVFVPNEDLLADADEFADYIGRIKSGFILLQMGIGGGIIDGCLGVIRLANVSAGEVNTYLDHSFDDIQTALNQAWAETERLADAAWNNQPELLPTLKLRLAGGELSLAAAQSAALHAGAKGYLMRSPAQRRMREAMFVAIVTPATKHLRKEIAALEAA